MEKSLKDLLTRFNQEHLLDVENENFKKHLAEIDFKLLHTLYNQYLNKEKLVIVPIENLEITPIKSSYSKRDYGREQYDKVYRKGLEKIAEGKVALLLLAGGQGSRLGFDKAKGMFNIGMPSNKSLFEYLCQRFLSVQRLSGNEKSLLLIMTSKENHKETVSYFEEQKYFQINPNNIIFFPQDTIPALTMEGKVILKSKDEIFEAPNGNGGCFIAMKKHKIIEKCLEKGVEYIHVISIDNPLSKTLDPFFIGSTYQEGYSMSAKFVPKREPTEPVGVFLNVNGKPMMMDYGDIPKHLCEERNESQDLIYRASNILNYLISVKTLNNVLLNEDEYNQLISEFHISKKKIPCYNLTKGVEETIDGLKFELFFNSIFQFAEEKGLLLLEVDRSEEFAPVKNSDQAPNDNPRSAKKLISNLFKLWYKNAGGKIIGDNEDFLYEFSFLFSYDGENIKPGENVAKEINSGDYIYLG
jgi:UDP-N-acetylglucosamine/UDP-N-acetylgalactosamine diphosphorylase